MKATRVLVEDPSEVQKYLEDGYILINRPMGSKIFRAYVPEQYRERKDVMQIFELWSKGIQRNGVYYIRASEEDILEELLGTLYYMDFQDHVIVSVPDEDVFMTSKKSMSSN